MVIKITGKALAQGDDCPDSGQTQRLWKYTGVAAVKTGNSCGQVGIYDFTDPAACRRMGTEWIENDDVR